MTTIRPIAHIRTPFKDKFGVPRQSGLVEEAWGHIVFEPEYGTAEAVKGIQDFSHLWLIWGFSENSEDRVKLTVAPPRLGGREKRGVFATRAPFRPNGLGLSCVRLKDCVVDDKGRVSLLVLGVDMVDMTPIYDIKPYLPYTDLRADATGGFGELHKDDNIAVEISEELCSRLPKNLRDPVFKLLSQDPRAAYNKKPDYIYGFIYENFDIRFKAFHDRIVVTDIVQIDAEGYQHVK